MTYTYRIAGHYGDYDCANCGLRRNEPDVIAVTQDAGTLVLTDATGHDAVSQKDATRHDALSQTLPHLRLKLPGVTSAYNFCAAVATAKAVGIDVSDSVKALDGYELKSGRTTRLTLGTREGLLLIAKHENTFAYDASLSWIINQKKPCTVVVLVDAISRKYYTSETSWLWDINFGILADDNVKNIVLAGRYVNELGARFAFTSIDNNKIGYVADLSGLRGFVEKNTVGDIYAITCFADKVKLLDATC